MPAPTDTPPSDAADSRPRTGALVVIADADFRKEVSEAAREEGPALTEAGTIDEALAGWGDGIGVVILDATLADSAPPLLQRSREAGVPVRVAGRTDQVDEVVGLLESGARGFIALPQPPQAVIQEARNALAREAERHLEDTTRMGRAKKELQAVFDTFPSALFVVGPDLCIRRANKAALSLPGKGVLPNPIGSDVRVMFGERLSRAGSGLLAAAVSGDSVAEFDLDVAAGIEIGKSARVYHLRVFPAEAGKAEPGLPVFPVDARGDPSGGLGDGALVLVEDVTLSRREEAEHARHQQLEAVTLLAATLSHEINQPLGTILGRAQLSLMCLEQDGFEKALLKRDLQEVIQSVRRVSQILEKLHSVTEIVTKPYLGDAEILDLDRSTEPFGQGLGRKSGPGKGSARPGGNGGDTAK